MHQQEKGSEIHVATKERTVLSVNFIGAMEDNKKESIFQKVEPEPTGNGKQGCFLKEQNKVLIKKKNSFILCVKLCNF